MLEEKLGHVLQESWEGKDLLIGGWILSHALFASSLEFVCVVDKEIASEATGLLRMSRVPESTMMLLSDTV